MRGSPPASSRRFRQWRGWLLLTGFAALGGPALGAQSPVASAEVPGHGAQTQFNLEQIVTLVEAQNAALQLSQLELLKSEDQTRLARGSLLPQVSAFLQWVVQDSATLPSILTLRLGAQINLFRGFKDWNAWNLAKQREEVSRLSERAKREELIKQTLLISLERERLSRVRQSLEAEIQLHEARLKTLRQFDRVGRARQADLFTVEAAQSQARAQLLATAADEARTDSLWTLWVGSPVPFRVDWLMALSRRGVGGLAGDQRSAEKAGQRLGLSSLSVEPSGLHEPNWNDRPEIRALLLLIETQAHAVKVQEAGHWPTLDLDARLYPERPIGFGGTPRWDLGLTLQFPIYLGGTVSAQVALAEREADQLRVRYRDLLRQRQEEYRGESQAWLRNLEESRQWSQALKHASAAAQAMHRDSVQGRASVLEALQALMQELTVRRSLDAAEIKAAITWVKKQDLVGGLIALERH